MTVEETWSKVKEQFLKLPEVQKQGQIYCEITQRTS